MNARKSLKVKRSTNERNTSLFKHQFKFHRAKISQEEEEEVWLSVKEKRF